MKKAIKYSIIALLVVGCFGCYGEFGTYSVEQEVRVMDCCKNLSPSGTCLITYVWHNGEIIEAWYDDLPTITDSTKIFRRKQAKQVIANLKK